MSLALPSFAASGTVKAKDGMADLSYWGDEDLKSDTWRIVDLHFREFETTYNGKKYTTYCREHEEINSPFNSEPCTITPASINSDYAKVLYWFGLGKGWTEHDKGRLRLSRTLSRINGHPCEPYKTSVVDAWIQEARDNVPSIPDAANFEIYYVTPSKTAQQLICFDGVFVQSGKLKLKKVSANTGITG